MIYKKDFMRYHGNTNQSYICYNTSHILMMAAKIGEIGENYNTGFWWESDANILKGLEDRETYDNITYELSKTGVIARMG